MWNEMCDKLHISRSPSQRIRYENDDKVNYDVYTQRLIEDQEIYDEEGALDEYDRKIIDIYAE